MIHICNVARYQAPSAEELQKMRLLGTEQTIPLFTEVLSAFRQGGGPLIVELKNGRRNRELCEKTYALLQDYRGEACVESFNPFIVMWFRFHAKDLLRGQLAQLIRGVVCQQLVPKVGGGLVPVFEVMKSTPAIQNMIREGKLHQLDSAMQAASADGMCTMDGSLLELYKDGIITKETALLSCVHYENMIKRLG